MNTAPRPYRPGLGVLVALVLAAAPAAAQDHGIAVLGHLGLGPGSHLISRSSATGVAGGVTLRVGRRIATIQIQSQYYPDDPRNVWGAGFLIGRVVDLGPAAGWFAIGLAAAGGEYEQCISHGSIFTTSYDCRIRPFGPTLALPVETRLVLWPRHLVGVDLMAYVNVNRYRPFTGVAAAVRVGRALPRPEP